MRYGIFSDVHANAEAFEAVLKTMQAAGVGHYIFVGDIVGYGAEPERCITMLQDLGREAPCDAVAGNHDYAVCGITSTRTYNRYARESIDWTKQQLGPKSLQYLQQLPLVGQLDHFTIVHANLETPEEWGYILDIDDAYPSFKILQQPLAFIGHSHRPVIFTAGEMVDWFLQDDLILQPEQKYIINVGSVGQPRDGNPLAAFGLYDSDTRRFQLKRVPYDVESAQKKILAAGLPRILAERLSVGK